MSDTWLVAALARYIRYFCYNAKEGWTTQP